MGCQNLFPSNPFFPTSVLESRKPEKKKEEKRVVNIEKAVYNKRKFN